MSSPTESDPAPETAKEQRPIRRRHAVDGRVRFGCMTCKARRKKCEGHSSGDENRCTACIRLGLVCQWQPLRKVSPRPRTKGRLPRASEDTPSPGSSSSSSASSSSLSRPARSQPRATIADNSPRQDQAPGPDLDPDPDQAQDQLDHETAGPAPLDTQIHFPLMPVSINGHKRNLLKHFLDRAAPLCSILQQDGHTFCSVLLPMAIVDPSLLYALFTYALVHYDATTVPTTPAIPSPSRLEFRSQVAHGISAAIAKRAVTETTVACALVLSLAEVVDGDTSQWQVHLQGAGHLINHLSTRRLLQTPDGAFLLRNFAYHDVMAALSTGRRPLIEGVYWVDGSDATVDSADSFMGLAHHILRHISDICSFVADTSDLDGTSLDDINCDRLSRDVAGACNIAYALRTQDLHINKTVLLSGDKGNVEALLHHAEAFRFAALLHLYRHLLRICGPSALYESHVAECARKTLHHVSLIPSNLLCEIGLMFPLFMAGVVSRDDPEAVDYIQSRFRYIEGWSKFKHATRAREVLEMLWSENRTDWETLLQELQWQIPLG